jgi:hypothetical protein
VVFNVAAAVEVVVFVAATIEEVVAAVVFEVEAVVVVAEVAVDFEVAEDVVTDIEKEDLFSVLPVICHFLYGTYNYCCFFLFVIYTKQTT